MFEDRAISIWTYNIETLLAEKLETIMARGTTNTRMRDFYDIHIISQQETIDFEILRDAFMATSSKRNTTSMIPEFDTIIIEVENSETMKRDWNNYKADNFFVEDVMWEEVMGSVKVLREKL